MTQENNQNVNYPQKVGFWIIFITLRNLTNKLSTLTHITFTTRIFKVTLKIQHWDHLQHGVYQFFSPNCTTRQWRDFFFNGINAQRKNNKKGDNNKTTLETRKLVDKK